MYTVQALVLRRNDFKPQEAVLTLFSRDFGRFDAFYRFSKTTPKLDMGSLLKASVVTKKGKNTLSSVSTWEHVDTAEWNYAAYEFFLWFMNNMYRLLPEGNAYVHYFDDVRSLYDKSTGSIGSITKLMFLTLRLLVIFGIHQATDDTGLAGVMRGMRHARYEDVREQLQRLDARVVQTYAQQCCDHFIHSA